MYVCIYACMHVCMYVCMYVYEYAYSFMVFLPRCSLLVSKIQRANSERQELAGMRCGTTKAARKSDACACEKLLFNYQPTRWVGVVWGQEESWWNLRPETHVMLTLTKGFDSRSRWYDSWQLPKYSLLMEVYLEPCCTRDWLHSFKPLTSSSLFSEFARFLHLQSVGFCCDFLPASCMLQGWVFAKRNLWVIFNFIFLCRHRSVGSCSACTRGLVTSSTLNMLKRKKQGWWSAGWIRWSSCVCVLLEDVLRTDGVSFLSRIIDRCGISDAAWAKLQAASSHTKFGVFLFRVSHAFRSLFTHAHRINWLIAWLLACLVRS